MRSRALWATVAVAASWMLVATVIVGGAAAIIRFLDDGLEPVVGITIGTVVLFMFWRWIQVGAQRRVRLLEEADEDGSARSIGPWGFVCGVLTVLVLGGLIGLGIWSLTSLRADQDRAETARDEAVAAAKRRKLDVETVRVVQQERLSASWGGEVHEDDLDELLPLEHGRVVAVSVAADTASLLIRPQGGGPPCAVVDIVHGDLVRGRLSNDC